MERIKKHFNIPDDVATLHNLFKQNGAELYLVGGCVRDLVMGFEPKDYDLTTNVNPDEVVRILASGKIKYIDEDSRFGTIRALINFTDYEIVTFRSDGDYLDNRRPDSVTFGTIELDAKRRDFTINSLYYDLNNNEIIDFNNGLKDIEDKRLIFVGNAYDRLNEDPLRLLRAIRFSFKYNMYIDMEILKPFSDLKGVTPERIRKEFVSASQSKITNKKLLLQMFVDAGVFEKVFGFETHLDYNDMITNIDLSHTSMFAYLLHIHNFKGDIKKHLNNLKYSRDEAEDVNFIFRMIRMQKEDLYDLMKYIDRKNYKQTDLEILDIFLTPKKQQWLKGMLYSQTYSSDYVVKTYDVSGVELGQKLRELHTEAILNF